MGDGILASEKGGQSTRVADQGRKMISTTFSKHNSIYVIQTEKIHSLHGHLVSKKEENA